MQTATNSHARRLFDGIASAYDTPAEVFSFGQYGRWRRFAVRTLRLPRTARVLDVATGTGLVARDVGRRSGATVVGLDQSPRMLRRSKERGLLVTGGRAERLPFENATFDGLTFTYLLRYVDDPLETLRELARVLKPGAPAVSVEFGVPSGGLTGPLWHLYTRRVFPSLIGLISRGWRDVGGFLPGSIVEFNERLPPEAVTALWSTAGFHEVGFRQMSFGAGVVNWGYRRG